MDQILKYNVYVMGDTHTSDFVDILKHYELEDFILIHVGDFSIGFRSYESDMFYIDKLNKYCREHNGRILVIRGNHDLPTAFVGDSIYNTEFVEFVKDYTYKIINGKTFLFAGGAVSIDRQARIAGKDYWFEEGFVLPDDYTSLSVCDVLITHSAPVGFLPGKEGFAGISGWFKNDITLKDELIRERRDLLTLYNHVQPKLAFFHGHFHVSSVQYINGILHRCLDINELVVWSY